MLTKRSKGMKECYEKILADFNKMKKANDEFVEFADVLHKDQTYSESYKASKLEAARSATDNAMQICANSIIDAVHKLYAFIEQDPEPVDVNDSKKQNVLSMLNMLGKDLPFEQASYFVESARGDFQWLEILGKMLKRYEFSHQAELCEAYRAVPAEWQLADFVGKMAWVAQVPRDFNANNFGWDMVNFKKWLNVLEVTVSDTPDLKTQVDRYKKEIAATRAENEILKEQDALHVDIINHLAEKIN